jgi:hypothetical protein
MSSWPCGSDFLSLESIFMRGVSGALLHDVRQLMRQKLLPLHVMRVVASFIKIDIGADRICMRIEPARGVGCLDVGMDADMIEIVSDTLSHVALRVFLKRLATPLGDKDGRGRTACFAGTAFTFRHAGVVGNDVVLFHLLVTIPSRSALRLEFFLRRFLFRFRRRFNFLPLETHYRLAHYVGTANISARLHHFFSDTICLSFERVARLAES